jgi:hypothetical protein
LLFQLIDELGDIRLIHGQIRKRGKPRCGILPQADSLGTQRAAAWHPETGNNPHALCVQAAAALAALPRAAGRKQASNTTRYGQIGDRLLCPHIRLTPWADHIVENSRRKFGAQWVDSAVL